MDTNNKTDIDSIIQEVYQKTFNIVGNIYKREHTKDPTKKPPKEIGTKLIIPRTRDGKIRLCEQELRFVFIEQLNQNCDFKNNFYYSVETPTIGKYQFTGKIKLSGNIDLVIFDTHCKRVALIEFKAKNQGDYKTDFLKLCSENTKTSEEVENISRHFIQILTSFNKNTKPNITKKRDSIVTMIKKQKETYPELLEIDKIKHICYSINIPKKWKDKDPYLF